RRSPLPIGKNLDSSTRPLTPPTRNSAAMGSPPMLSATIDDRRTSTLPAANLVRSRLFLHAHQNRGPFRACAAGALGIPVAGRHGESVWTTKGGDHHFINRAAVGATIRSVAVDASDFRTGCPGLAHVSLCSLKPCDALRTGIALRTGVAF